MYPKRLYRGDKTCIRIVKNEEEEAKATKLGYTKDGKKPTVSEPKKEAPKKPNKEAPKKKIAKKKAAKKVDIPVEE